MAAYEVLLLNTAIPQIQAAQSGDTYVVPRDIAINATAIISANSATDALRITQTGAGNAILVEDSANPDASPFVVTAVGDVGIGTSSPQSKLHILGNNSTANVQLSGNYSAGENNNNIGLKIQVAGYGSSGAWPTFGFAPDYGSGNFNLLFENVGNTYQFTSSATKVLSVTQSGNLGVGTTNPAQKLHVATTVGNAYMRVERANQSTGQVGLQIAGGTSSTEWFMYIPTSSNTLTWFGNSTNLMSLDTSGNLGIGVTPSAWASSWRALQTLGGNSFYSDSTVSALASNAIYDGVWKYVNTAGAGTYQINRNAHNWYTAPSGTAGNAITFTQAMTLDASGNLGIGATSPAQKLEVQSAAGATVLVSSSTTGGSTCAVQFKPGFSGVYGDQKISAINAELRISSSTVGGANAITTFYNGASEAARITSGGYFKASNSGSYDSSTGTYHELYQTADSRGVLVRATNASFSSNVIEGTASRTTTASNYNLIYVYNGNATGQFAVRDSGNAVNTNNSYGSISDQKLKQDIVDAGSQWDDIKNLQVRKYRFKATPDAPLQIGLVAQEAETVSPGLVEETADRDADGNDLGTTTKAVKYSVLYMKAVKALQEAMARIEQLEAKVASLGA